MPADETFVTSVVETFSDTVTASVVTIGVRTFSDTVTASVVTIGVRTFSDTVTASVVTIGVRTFSDTVIAACQMQTPLFILYSLCPCLKYLFLLNVLQFMQTVQRSCNLG